jgi:predicted Zn-dependent protease
VLSLAGCQTAPIVPLESEEDTRELTPEERRLWHAADEFDLGLVRADRLYEDEALQDYVQGVLDRLYPEYRGAIRVGVVDSPSLNAFALPNGSIYVNTGMLARLDNEAQMATVLAHEGVHFTHKHSWQQRRNIKHSTAFSTSFGIVTGVPLLGDLLAVSSIYGFSKDLEREADVEGFERLEMAGYDVSQAPVTFEHLKAEVEALDIDEPYFFSTHPRLQERIESFNALVAQRATPGGQRGTEAYLARVGRLKFELLAGYLELGQYQSVLLILEDPARTEDYPPAASFYLGEAYRLRGEEGDDQRAWAAYRRAVEGDPAFAPSYRALGIYHMKREQAGEAERFFSRYLELQPAAPDRAYIERYREILREGHQ